MFKNAIIYHLQSTINEDALIHGDALAMHVFQPCGLTQEKSVGWTPPRGQDFGPLVESIDGNLIMRLDIETKSVPSDVLERNVKERCAQIEHSTGRKPSKKETRDLKDEERLNLLPMAFSKRASVLVWIDTKNQLLIVDASSQTKSDEVLTALAQSIEGLGATPLQTLTSPATAMSDWLLSQEPPAGFSVDRECELKATDDSKAVVRYANHALDIEEVQKHIEHGKRPTRLALTWGGEVFFVLTDALQLKKITFSEGVFLDNAASSKDDRFDADVAIFCGELRKLVPDLIEALGGEIEVVTGNE